MGKVLKTDNIQSVQLLRGLAAFFVLLSHSLMGKYQPHNIVATICDHGWMGVDIFFVISGFIIPYSMYKNNYELKDFRVFFARRLTRIEPPYIISIFLVLLLNYSNTLSPWYTGGPAKSIDWLNVLGHLGYLNAFTHWPWLNWAYWTLAIEFQYYIILALFYPLIASNKKAVLLCTFFVLLACTFINFPGYAEFPPFFAGMPVHSDSAAQIFGFLPFFLIGIALFLYRVGRVTFTEFLPMLIIALIMCAYRLGWVLCGVSILTILAIHYIKRVPAVFMWLGTISYSLYLTHGVLAPRFVALSMRYSHLGENFSWLFSIVACLGVAYLYYVVVEKPFIKISKKIGYQHPAERPVAADVTTV